MSSPKIGKAVAMARTDDDSWNITEGVGQTALGVAMARAEETAGECPLVIDPYAQLFLDAAAERGWQRPPSYMVERIRSISAYAASRTKWFDEFFIAAGASGIKQAVILAAGLDARAWRLPWVDGSVVYEIDQPKVLAFKAQTLRAHDAQPAARYVQVPADLRQDWPKALRDAGFDASEPTAWAAEGLLPYLPADAQDLLFERIHQHSARDSRIGVESFGAGFFDSDYLASRREKMRQLREEAGASDDDGIPDTQDLWFIEERTDVVDWLTEHCWDVTSVEAADLMTRYGRCKPGEVDDASPPTVFVDAHLTGAKPLAAPETT
jgi:methyltransferase (TIGR00027 family)